MEPTEAEKLKARRVQLFLLVLMALLITAPMLVFLAQSRGK
jgi:hypothetical protein